MEEVLILFKEFGKLGITFAVLWYLLDKQIKKTDEKDARISDQEDRLEKSSERTIDLLTNVIKSNTAALQATEDVINRNTEALKDLKALLEKKLFDL